MDFALTEEQEMLKTMARDFLANECPKTMVKEIMESEEDHSPALWKKMAELGWLGLVLPEEHGGTAMTFRDLTILCQEMGRAVLPGPFIPTVLFAALPILEAGTEEQKKELLPKIVNGEAAFTYAVTEEDGELWAEDVKTRAVAQGGDYIINGTKVFVPDAKAADYMVVAARTKNTPDPEDGITLFIVNTGQFGIYISPLKTMDQTRKLYEVSFNNVSVPAENILGELNQGWDIVKKATLKATAAVCADMIGGCETVLEMTVDYVKERVQFGVPVGSFQAVKHRCADMQVDVEYARALMEWAALAIDEDSADAPIAVSMAKSLCGDNYKKITNAGVQLHGGMGFTWDHDMHLYFKRARSTDTILGDSIYHRELVAQSFDD